MNVAFAKAAPASRRGRMIEPSRVIIPLLIDLPSDSSVLITGFCRETQARHVNNTTCK